MKIYIKTPLYKKSKYIAHSIEHSVLFSSSIKDFFCIYMNTYAYTGLGYTVYECDDNDWEKIYHKILKSPSKESIEYQKKIVLSEHVYPNYDQKLYQYIIQKITGDIDMKINAHHAYTIQELKRYHKKWYQQNNIIVYNDQKKQIINRYSKSIKRNPKVQGESTIEVKKIRYQKEQYTVLYMKYKSPYDIIYCDFIESIWQAVGCYNTTIKSKIYNDPIDVSITDTYYICTIQGGVKSFSIKKYFFDTYKKYYIEEIEKGNMRAYIPQIALCTGYSISIQKHKKYIQDIKWEDIKKTINIIKNT